MKKKSLPYKKDTGFQIPEGYFENFESSLMSKISTDELNFGNSPFKLPPNYFEELENNVLQKIEAETSKTKVIELRKKIIFYASAAAAMLALLFSLPNTSDTFPTSFNDLDVSAIENYLFETENANNSDNLPVDSLYFATAKMIKPEIDKDALLEYLNENIEETALLYNE